MVQRTIVLKGRGIRKEANAGGAVTPGHLVELATDGDIEVHSTAAGTAQKAFAVENELAGKEITEAYIADETIFYEILPTGAEAYALLAAGAAAIVIGDKLESAGDGTLRKVTTAAATADTARGSVVAIAMEAIDNSGGGSIVRIEVEVL